MWPYHLDPQPGSQLPHPFRCLENELVASLAGTNFAWACASSSVRA